MGDPPLRYPRVGEWKSSYAWLEVDDAWLRVVQDYTRCMLTYSADKLPACGAVADAFRGVLRSDYLAGMWPLARHSHRQTALEERSTTSLAPTYGLSCAVVVVGGLRGARQDAGKRTRVAGARGGGTVRGLAQGRCTAVRPGYGRHPRPARRVDTECGAQDTRTIQKVTAYFPQYARQARQWQLAGGARDENEVKLGRKLLGDTTIDWKDDMDAAKLWMVPLSLQVDEDGHLLVVGLVVRWRKHRAA